MRFLHAIPIAATLLALTACSTDSAPRAPHIRRERPRRGDAPRGGATAAPRRRATARHSSAGAASRRRTAARARCCRRGRSWRARCGQRSPCGLSAAALADRALQRYRERHARRWGSRLRAALRALVRRLRRSDAGFTCRRASISTPRTWTSGRIRWARPRGRNSRGTASASRRACSARTVRPRRLDMIAYDGRTI